MTWNQLMLWAGSKNFSVLVNDETLKLPRKLYRTVGVDLGMRRGTYFEEPVMVGLRESVRPGDCVIDAGCSYGILTCLMAKMVGPRGQVHAFEANPEVLAWAKQITSENLPGRNVHFVHACLSDRGGADAQFFVVPGKSSVASTRNSDIVVFHPESQATAVPMLALDEYCRSRKIVPSCIKLDVEGSECLVIQGAMEILRKYHPRLIVETHGLEIKGIGGSVAELCEMVDRFGYRIFDLTESKQVTSPGYANEYSERIGYFLAT